LKNKLNRAIKAFKDLLDMKRNQRIQEYLSKLSATPETSYSPWKVTKRLKQPQTQYPSVRMGIGPEVKKETFAGHLSKVFIPNSRGIILKKENKLLSDNTISCPRYLYKTLYYQ